MMYRMMTDRYGRDCPTATLEDLRAVCTANGWRDTLREHFEYVLDADGVVGRMIPSYCTQNYGACETCSLVNYGRDCVNNPIPE